MVDQWTDRLSEYLDGELPRAEREALEAHMAVCADCWTALKELRQVLDRARTLEDRPPGTDLWAGIAERIGAAHEPIADVAGPEQRRRSAAHRLSFSLPQLVAAGIALALLSGGAVWIAQTGGPTATGDPPPLAGAPPRTEVPGAVRALPAPAFASAPYDDAVADLERILAEGRGRLEPATVRILEENLRIIDRAIEDARGALAVDPGNAYLNRHLAGTRQLKLELLRQASTIVRAET